MPLNSYVFILAFLPLTTAGFWLLVRRGGRGAAVDWLILASVAFYAYDNIVNLAVIGPSIVLDFLIARSLLRADPTRARMRLTLLLCGVTCNILLLGFFKYKNFFLGTANTLIGAHFVLSPLILPLGISFITFQKIAFLLDSYSGQVKTMGLLDFLLFALFFPRTLAGPIVHYDEVMPQLAQPAYNKFAGHLAAAVCLFSVGLFKKAVIADNLLQFVTPAFDTMSPGIPLTMLTAWAGALAFTFQLYFDFSGYSDMALGAARLFGVRLPVNFNSPLKASSIVEFWSRWHITLTRFLTAYLYTPITVYLTRARMDKGKSVLRGKRSNMSAIVTLVGVPTLTTMSISGFWHGAGWQFILWGFLHGVLLTINQSWRMLRSRFWRDQGSYHRVMRPVGFVLTFGAVVILFVFFRASSVSAALNILGAMTGKNGVWPYGAQLLEHFGGELPWRLLVLYFEPIKPFLWIGLLLLAVLTLPNSLELLRRFEPALDFPANEATGSATKPLIAGAEASSIRLHNLGFRKIRATTKYVWMQLKSEGIPLNRVTAWITALLSVLGIAALKHSQSFVYLHF